MCKVSYHCGQLAGSGITDLDFKESLVSSYKISFASVFGLILIVGF